MKTEGSEEVVSWASLVDRSSAEQLVCPECRPASHSAMTTNEFYPLVYVTEITPRAHASHSSQARLRNDFLAPGGRGCGALVDADFASGAGKRRRRRRNPMPNSVRIVGNSGLPRSRYTHQSRRLLERRAALRMMTSSGTAKNAPAMPHIQAHTITARKTNSGLISSRRPTIHGAMKLLSMTLMTA
jgi:hypothetical protein